MTNDEKKGPVFTGRVWTETKSKVIMSGNIVKTDTKESDTPDKRYIKIIKSENDKGEVKTEICMSLGLIYTNSDKKNKFSPDAGGPVTIDNLALKLGAWIQETEGTGDEWSLSLSEPFKKDEKEDEDKYPF
tara:strand:- start:1172 stop:1564 length:393 start_codon:yes stop_codon:yes gene_type:complete